MSIPVFVRQSGETIPEKGMGYIVSREGLQLRLDNDWLSAVIPVREFKSLESEPKRASLLLKPIDALLFAKIVAFYREIFEQKRTEVAVLLHYNFTTNEWLFTVPTQRVSPSGVEYYDMKERVPGYRCVGTSHSHASFPAGHSQTDIMDEQCFDGVHITVGNLNRYPEVTLSPEIVVRGVRFPLPIEKIDGISAAEPPASQSIWVARFDRYYKIDPAVLGDWKVPEEWVEKVSLSARTFGTNGKSVKILVNPVDQDEPEFGELTDAFSVYPATKRRIPAVEAKSLTTPSPAPVEPIVPSEVSQTQKQPDQTTIPLQVPLYHPLKDLWKSIMFVFFGKTSKQEQKKQTSVEASVAEKTDTKKE